MLPDPKSSHLCVVKLLWQSVCNLMQAQRWVDRIRKPGGFQKAVTLQLEGLWHAHKRKVIGVAAVFGMYLLW